LNLTPTEPADINSPEVAKTPGGGSGQGKDENVVNGHKEGDANPFAEYMWMENEEEYNRQVSVNLLQLLYTNFLVKNWTWTPSQVIFTTVKLWYNFDTKCLSWACHKLYTC